MAEAPAPSDAPAPEPIDLDHPTPRQRRSLRYKLFRALVIALATFGGAVTGFVVMLAIVVTEAQAGNFIYALEDLIAFRWEILPVPLFAVLAFLLARKRPGAMAWATVIGFAGLLFGIVVGAVVGSAVFGEDTGPWAGGVLGGAVCLIAGAVMALRIRHVPKHPVVAAGATTIALLGVFGFAAFGATNYLHVDPLEFGETGGIPVPEPADVDAVVFLLGDAGAAERSTSPLLDAIAADVERWSSALKRDSAVSVIYLGDNVYPVGVRDRDHPEFEKDSSHLWSQVDIVGGPEARKYGSVGLFLTGNHDWGNTVGDEGIGRVKNQQEQLLLARERGTYVSLIPNAGDPGPIVRDLRRNARVIFIDTHWFLQERHPSAQDQFFGRFRNALDGAGDRETIVVAHHPYFSAGPHGAVVPAYHKGGLDYILKRSGALVQDLNSPPYANLLGRLRALFEATKRPPLVYAGGHDHSLQVLTGAADFDPRFNLVSGAGSKVSALAMGPGLVWGGEQPGYMMLVFRKDDGVDLFVVGGDRQYLKCAGTPELVDQCRAEGVNAFEIVYSASLLGPSKQPRELTPVIPDSLLLPDTLAPGTPWWTEERPVRGAIAAEQEREELRPAPVAVSTRVLLASIDSAVTTPGRTYPAGRVKRFFAGDMNRHLWRVPVKLPVMDLGSIGGGLHPQEIIGGKQTVGLRFIGRDGVEYEFRPVVKNPAAVLPEMLREGPVFSALDDQMAAQFPFGALVVARLLDAAGIVAPEPVAVVMPNDPRLGEYRSMFAGRVGLLAVNANEGKDDAPDFGGYAKIVGSEELDEELREDPAASIDAKHFLRIRMIDILVGDWDRHQGQWRWGRRTVGGAPQWRAIPEDRDWAFAHIDGLVGVLTRALVPRYVGYGERLPPVRRLAQSGTAIDRRVMGTMSRGDFVSAARDVRRILSDSVIDAAVSALPAPYLALERDRLVRTLRARREQLVEFSEGYFDHVMRNVEVHTHDRIADVVRFERRPRSMVRVTLHAAGDSSAIRFDRVIDPRVTRQVTLYLNDDDRVEGTANLPFTLKVVDVERKPREEKGGEATKAARTARTGGRVPSPRSASGS